MLTVIWGLVSALWVVRFLFVPGPIPYFYGVLLLGYAGGLYAAWSAVSPVTAIDAPTIVRRAPGSPLPRRLRSS